MRPQLPLLLALTLAACHGRPPANPPATRTPGTVIAVRDTSRADFFEAEGVANPVEEATLSTRLMATVLAVTVTEGARVSAGQLLVRLDAADLAARRKQATAAIEDATTMHDLAGLTARRMRALYADSAAPRAQLDAAESSLARADAALASAQQAAAEVDAMASYAEIRAPFDGVVTHRFVDPGAFAGPGAPLLTVAATTRLRVSAVIPADLARPLQRGQLITVRLEGQTVNGTVEGVVPSSGNLYTVNAVVDNAGGSYLAGSAAAILVPQTERRVMLVPAAALVHEGDLVGVRRRFAAGDGITWVTTGAAVGTEVEVLSGLAAGDSVIIPGAR